MVFTRFATAAILLASIAHSAQAQLVGNAAGPRLGPVYVVHLDSTDRDVVRELNDRGFSIGHVMSGHVELFTTPEEYDVLVAEGFDVAIVGRQPDPPPATTRGARGLGVYHDYDGVTAELHAYAAAHPSITRLISLGQSVQGRELWAMFISDNPFQDEAEPEFKYVSTMHGDEPVGTEMCLFFIDHLLSNYGTDPRITWLINDTAIWVVPLMNPDGLELGTRANANGFDLNRSFPESGEDFVGPLFGNPPGFGGLEPEVIHLMAWSWQNSFVLSANFHTGAVVVSYPYDSEDGIPDGSPALSPDHPFYLDIATGYAQNNPPMFANNAPPFVNGTVNGNHWFIVEGGMQDWMYRRLGNFETTVELSVPKRPSESLLPGFWDDNRESMIGYVEQVHRGVRGIVTDAGSGEPLFAEVRVVGNSQITFSDPDVGDYYRLLVPGTYDLIFSALTYNTVVVEDVVVGDPDATVLDVQLSKIAGLRGPAPWLRVLLAAFLGAVAVVSLYRRAA